ncbi:hypothetical protein ACFYY8_06165 [Streptosporangium sp. NPDC001559]|uniref:hypothetical protein n=1 Tax=Streptosporangium sp. NPDC001559 TaxID=3366187 RepID=UPI0036E4A685
MSRGDDQKRRRLLLGPYDPANSYRARVDPETAHNAKDCEHCGQRIARITSAWGDLWATKGGYSTCSQSSDTFHKPASD